jgi:hypothetical protein
MKDDSDGVLCTEFRSFSVLLRFLNGTLNEYSTYNLIDTQFDNFSRPQKPSHQVATGHPLRLNQTGKADEVQCKKLVALATEGIRTNGIRTNSS